jgi:Family of unknown function (DUF5871)
MANVMSAILYKNFDPALVNFEPVFTNKRGGKMVRLTYGEHKNPIRIQTPEMYIKFQNIPDLKVTDKDKVAGQAQSVSTDPQNSFEAFTFDVAMDGYDKTNTAINIFYQKMLELDDRILQARVDFSQEWMGDQKKKEVVNEFHNKLVKQKNIKYSPLLRIKVDQLRADGTLPKVFDLSDGSSTFREELKLDVLNKGVKGKFIFALPSVWFVNKTMFGVTAKLIQSAITHRPQNNFSGYAFVEDDIEKSMVQGQTLGSFMEDDDLDI